MKTLREHLKEIHGNKHQDCNFGRSNFHLSKRNVKLSSDEAPGGKGKGKGGGTPPPPPPPPIHGGGCILLDFDGFTVTGTSWNYNGDIVCAPSGLSLTEKDYITSSIVNDYKDFNVVVTTDESIYNSYPSTNRQRVIFTESWEWYGQAGGTSFVGSYAWSTDDPCFVFTSLLGYNLREIWTAGTHEAGHTMGLYHQSAYDTNCIKTNEYNHGTATECPFMGYPYENWKIPEWWIGPNPYGCNNIQHDHDIILSVLGAK